MSEAGQIKSACARLERAADEAYSRYGGVPEAQRIDGIAAALEESLAGEPEARRAALLEMLAERFAACPLPQLPRAETDDASAAELAALRLEVERLHAVQDRAGGEAVRTPPPEIVEVLLGREAARLAEEGPLAVANVAGVVQQLVTFVMDLGRAFLGMGAGSHDGGTVRQLDRLRQAVRGEVLGSGQAGSLATVLEELKLQVGVQLQALPVACNDGAQQLLKELDPLMLEDQAQEQALKLGGLRPFRHREAWEAFRKRHAELVSSEDLYRTYFDGPLRRALRRLQEAKP